MLSTKYKDVLETIRVWLNPKYSHTRCPACMFLVDVNPNGDMVEHGSGVTGCIGGGWNDEELAELLDKGLVPTKTETIDTDGTATH